MQTTPLFSTECVLERIENTYTRLHWFLNSLRDLMNPMVSNNLHFNELFKQITNTIYCANSSEDETISGTLYLVGIGKNKFILEKTAASFRSIGVKCFYLSADSCMHGDLGVVKASDIVITVSKSGENLNYILDYVLKLTKNKLKGLSLFSISMRESKNKLYNSLTLVLPEPNELDDAGVLPTITTISFQIFLDLIVSEVGMLLGVTTEDLASNHPSGQLGRLLNK